MKELKIYQIRSLAFGKAIIKRLHVLLILTAFLSGMTGCKKFVEVNAPTTQLASVSVFGSDGTATAAQVAIYTAMANESFQMSWSCGLLSDELTNYSTDQLALQYYTNSMQALTNPGPWNNAYNYIYQANAIIEGLQNNGRITPAVAAQLIGESKFIRAFWYFYLVNLYGDVPLVLTTDYTVNKSISRTSQALVYSQIIADLKDAQDKLNANYVDISDIATTTERVRPTKAAAVALLARVNLYTKKYDAAELYASQVIDNKALYALCTNLSSVAGANYVFEKNSTEAIWQLATPVPSDYFTTDGEHFILAFAPSTTGANSATISQQLLVSFEPGDQRFAQWVGTYAEAPPSTVSYPFPYKYQSHDVGVTTDDPTAATEYVMMLRLAEQYLIRAEARAQQGKIPEAIADLNAIRNRAGLANYSGAMDQATVLAAIMHERQVELFAEWGHRWFDLIRTGNANSVMGVATPLKGGTWSTDGHQLLFPIPQSERLNDPNLSQNRGY
ncbi:MAG TPA: RagB/SusD family nutrient uptake outer membrane protein [Chitinophagaceae bacterium]|jgi:hypothetical protein